ncbi:uncharacterized protein LOC130673218 [Microplitis mediator]|uniref:uncharacterized protein LOC130673218 n=1 Tax=Microplitis mediator TaxID=375433 RepID=UPI0025525B97|nr:uncharacterized protein LOC130673218 [Microplitis mediator]XP_057334156.1 uncharacterized protein LOC130673218 [Microplitis mediator]
MDSRLIQKLKNSNIREDGISRCSCNHYCLYRYMDSKFIREYCFIADDIFGELAHVIKLQDDLKKGIELIMRSGKPLLEERTGFLEYHVVSIIAANSLILNLEKCPNARGIIRGTKYERIYFAAKEKYSEAIDRLMKISEEEMLLLKENVYREIDL